jgi:hypothetical protein
MTTEDNNVIYLVISALHSHYGWIIPLYTCHIHPYPQNRPKTWLEDYPMDEKVLVIISPLCFYVSGLSLVIPFTKGNPTNTNHYNQLYT